MLEPGNTTPIHVDIITHLPIHAHIITHIYILHYTSGCADDDPSLLPGSYSSGFKDSTWPSDQLHPDLAEFLVQPGC